MMGDKDISTIHIKGGEVLATVSSLNKYRVLEGTVLVYIMPIDGDSEDMSFGRRMFFAEVGEGALIPGLFIDDENYGAWCFGLVALERAEIEELSGTEEADIESIRREFLDILKLPADYGEGFEEALIELYNVNSIKEEGYIYNAMRGTEAVKEQSLKLIRDVFEKRTPWQERADIGSGDELYDCAAYLCGRERINIAPREKVIKSAKRGYTINDIARVSHFTLREIILQDGWYKKDGGAFLAFDKTRRPYCLFPSVPGKYVAYDARRGALIKVDREFAKDLSPQAIMFYRPFPDEKITLPKLVFFGMQKVYVSDIIRLVLLTILGTLTGLLVPYLNELVYDRFIPLGNAGALLQIGFVILTCALGNVTFTIVKNLAMFRAMNSMEYAVQSATIDRLFSLPESFFREYEAADLGLRAMNISGIYNILSESIINSVLSALFSFMYLFRMEGYSRELTLWAVVMLFLSVGFMISIGLRQAVHEKEKMDTDRTLSSDMFQYVEGIEKLRTSSSESRALLKYLQLFTRSRRINIKKERLTVIVSTTIEAAQIVFSIVFYYLMVRKGLGLTIGGFMGFISAFGSLQAAMFEISQNFLVVNQVKPMYEMARPILETLPENSTDTIVPGELEGDIEVNNVSFSYDEGDEPVLKGINLHFKSGEYIGIVGASGSGKSTLLKLLMGFEKPQVGRIYYDGQDIDELDKRELRKKFGVVLQDGGLIGGSIYDNITITSPGCGRQRVEEVIREVGLEKDIKAMPMGLQTPISEGGSTISGGQTQRILIARAIVGKPKIIFFDEATSALDNVTQNQVMETLKGLEATKIVIAHRLSTIEGCDRIIVMDAGRVIEEGSYQELMEKKGRFYELAIRQIA
ncbi:MAG: NHLP bacteriocin export ABC transporter permease/ATPase subunit [Lachnospiraceae bacterium]|nr:NHLP bacteriocin export ABC transporter permease/ATPase subunit [Lachnospiraceae bacterium]